jgi:uncharacterized protein
MSSAEILELLKPSFDPSGSQPESSNTEAIIKTLKLQQHPEGGYFVETDRDSLRIPNPFAADSSSSLVESRSASTTIFYYLTPKTPLGYFHRNKARTVHTLHKGRGRYVLIHADEIAEGSGAKAKIETFVVGQNVVEGEKLQWIVDGGKYKSSFLLPDEESGEKSDGLLISETVVPGFEFTDHDFLTKEKFAALLTPEQVKQMEWMVRKE